MEKKEKTNGDRWLALEMEDAVDEDERVKNASGLALAKLPGEGSEKTHSPLHLDAQT